MNILKAEKSHKTPDRTPLHQDLYRSLNLAILDVCRDLPRSLQIPATLQLMAGARRPSGGSQEAAWDFCQEFPVALWAVLAPPPHSPAPVADGNTAALSESPFSGSPGADNVDYRTAVRTQAMAFLLHIIDDHLSDGQARPDVLLLQLRTAVWNRFQAGVAPAGVIPANAVPGSGTTTGEDRVRAWIDLYFESVYEPGEPEDLSAYFELALKQMAIWSVAPALLALRRRAGPTGDDFAECAAIRTLLDSVVLAWRLTDDLEDWRDDARRGLRSALYHLAPESVREIWNAVGAACKYSDERDLTGTPEGEARIAELQSALERASVPAGARDLAREHLGAAAESARHLDRPDLEQILRAAARQITE
ncbi:MAG: hypothetical protein NXI24_13180 [bacterium]|nr:hypothetical protein [bacterium]